jgi:hypothetical protein
MMSGDVAMVAQSEHDLLMIARALVGEVSPAAVSSLLRAPHPLPARIGPTAMGILKQTLARGVVRELARRGGWRGDGAGHAGQGGRLWERHRPVALHFSPMTMELLRWLASAHLGGSPGGSAAPRWKIEDTTLADELMLYLAADLLEQADGRGAELVVVAGSPLCWLGFAGRLARAKHSAPPMAFDRWVQGDGAVILEALQPDLCRRWIAMEQGKRTIIEISEMITLGAAQEAVLEPLLTSVDRAGRRDLCSFVVDAAAALLAQGAPETSTGDARPIARIASGWVKNLAPVGPMRERAAARRASGALLRALGRVQRWDAEHRARRFFDDDYEVAQRLLARWEALGSSGLMRAERVLKELESLDASSTEAPEKGLKS